MCLMRAEEQSASDELLARSRAPRVAVQLGRNSRGGHHVRVLHGIGGSNGFEFFMGGLAITIQLWRIIGQGYLILTAILHATKRLPARHLSVVGILLLAIGLAHVAVVGIALLSDSSADDILLYAAPAAAILLFAGGILLIIGQLVALPNRREFLAGAGKTGSKILGEP